MFLRALGFAKLDLRLDGLANLACSTCDVGGPGFRGLRSCRSVALLQLLVVASQRFLHRLAERHHHYPLSESTDVAVVDVHEEAAEQLGPVRVVVLKYCNLNVIPSAAYRWPICAFLLHLEEMRPGHVASVGRQRLRSSVVDAFL